MLTFVNQEQEYPTQRAVGDRRLDFNEIYEPYSPENARVQAERCSQCGIPFCQIHCPLQNNIPDWLKMAAEGRLREAYEISSATNNFPEICGRICPQDTLCEGNCVIEKGFGSVTIGSVEKYITETAFAEGWVTAAKPARESGFSIGIIGAGPAGLSAADMLRRHGHAITVYDRYDRVGGLMIYGIPNFKLDKAVVARREQLLRESGITFELNMNIGVDISLSDLRKKHDAILIATGVYKSRELELPNAVAALDYLTASNRQELDAVIARSPAGTAGDSGDDEAIQQKTTAAKTRRAGLLRPEGGLAMTELVATAKHTVVIGGGDTAMDCVRTAIRQGAASVTCLYRRDRANMPGSAREVKNAEEEGVTFEWLSAPLDGRGSELVVQRMRLGAADASGRQSPEAIPGDTYTLKADLIIKALGFDAEDLPRLWNESGLTTTKYGTLAIDKNFMTALPNVYAAGDIVRGASLVVWAIKDGRDAAAAIHQKLITPNARVA